MNITEFKKNFFRFFCHPILGKKCFQNIFSYLHFFSLKGMYYGNGPMLQQSGEINVIKSLVTDWNNYNKNEPIIIFDVGANVGEYSLELIKQLSKTKFDYRIYCFEPSPIIFKKLQVALHKSTSLILENIGLSDKDRAAELFYNSQMDATSSLYQGSLLDFGLEVNERQKISLTTLDQYCEDKNIENINFLKIDVEGHELAVLLGGKSLLRRNKIKIIQFEMGRTSMEAKIYLKDFFDLLHAQYRIFRIVKDGIVELQNYDLKDEVFLTTNYLAKLR